MVLHTNAHNYNFNELQNKLLLSTWNPSLSSFSIYNVYLSHHMCVKSNGDETRDVKTFSHDSLCVFASTRAVHHIVSPPKSQG